MIVHGLADAFGKDLLIHRVAKNRLSISVVLYKPDITMFRDVFQRILASYKYAVSYYSGLHLYLINNGGAYYALEHVHSIKEQWSEFMSLTWISGHGNIGYGSGHNLAIAQAESDLHLVLNPDVLISEDAFLQAALFFDTHADAGVLAPLSYSNEGNMLYLCKRYPSPALLFLRGLPYPEIRRLWASRHAFYEMRDAINENDIYWDPPIMSGCFMLFRTAVLKSLYGFDPRFFLYFEDFDLSLRAGKQSRIVYVPAVKIIHTGGHAARKGRRHVAMFMKSAVLFFNKHGWKFF